MSNTAILRLPSHNGKPAIIVLANVTNISANHGTLAGSIVNFVDGSNVWVSDSPDEVWDGIPD